MATATASDKRITKIKVWLKNQPPEIQTRLGDMLEKGLVKEVEAELPAGWASKQKPVAQTVPKAAAAEPAKTPAPQAKGGKIRGGATKLQSVASNPSAKATKDAVTAELSAAGKAGATAAEGAAEGAAKGAAGTIAKAKGIGGKLMKYGAGLSVAGNIYGRGKEFYDDISTGKTVDEAINKPESNKALGEGLLDASLMAIGQRGGAMIGSRFGMPGVGAVAGGIALPMIGKVAARTYDVASNGPKNYRKPKEAEAPVAPKKVSSVSIEEAANWLQQRGIQDPSVEDYNRAFEQLDKMQQEQINKTPEPQPSADTYKPSAKESVAMAEQAVKAPIGIQDKAPEPDIMSFLNQPDTQRMIGELVAKQANRVQSAGNIPDFKPRKKNEDDEDGMGPSSTTTANVRPPPRFFVNTGRFGTMAGGGSRRSLSGRLL